MKSLKFLFLSITLINIPALGNSSDGSIVQVNGADIVVKYADIDHPFDVGTLLYCGPDKSVRLTVVFPMQSTAKCKLLSGNVSVVTIGSPIYKTPGFAEKKEIRLLPKLAGIEKGRLRFRDNGDGTITDMSTNLMWTKDANIYGTELEYDDIRSSVAECNVGGRIGWRIPTINELVSIKAAIPDDVLLSCRGCEWLSAVGFLNVMDTPYWSCSSKFFLGIGTSSTRYSHLLFSNGEIGTGDKSGELGLWLVR